MALHRVWRGMQVLAYLLVLGVVLVACSPQETEPELDLAGAEANLRAEEAAGAEYSDMARVLDLDPATADALKAAFSARDEAVQGWIDGEKGQRLIELEARMFAAVEARNLEGVKKATAAAKPLRNELRALIETHQQAIMDTLSEQQQVAWLGYQVSDKMLDLMQPLNLAFEQAQAIEQAGPQAVAAAIQRGEPNPKAAAFLELEQWVEGEVLSAEQSANYQDIKSKNKLRSLGA